MVAPEPAAQGQVVRLSDDSLVSLLRAVRLADDAASAMAAAVDVLADRFAIAWIVADPERDGRLEVIAASGAGAGAITGVVGRAASGAAPWREGCAAAGLTLTAWQPLGAASLSSAFLGLAVSAGDAADPDRGAREVDPVDTRERAEAGVGSREVVPRPGDPAAEEVARFIGAVVDVHAGRAAEAQLLATTGRLDWLEATRRASRSVRHDLANVLTGISFYGSQLAADLPPETASAMDAAAIGEAVERGGGLLNLLLELWRDAPEPEVVPLDPAAVVDAIARVLAVVAEPRALEVGPLESMVVRASRRLLEEALLALVVEARAATRGPGGPLILAVTVEQLAADNALGLPAGVYAAVSVGDAAPAPPDGVTEMAGGPRSGSGGSSQDGEPEVVSTLDANLASTRFGKPGRGIAIARHAARTAGGWLRIERWPGGGTRATILLPQAISRRRGAPEAGDARTDA